MTVYFQHVGEKGGARDFPKTIGDRKDGVVQFQFSELEPHLRDLSQEELSRLRETLKRECPDGFQVWGIPSGAKSVLRDLSRNDVLLLLESAGYGGAFAYAGKVVEFPSQECFEISRYLWGEARFPLIVFLKGEMTDYTWREFCKQFGYKSNWNPAGQTYRIGEDRLQIAGIKKDSEVLRLLIGENLENEGEIYDPDEFGDPAEEFFSEMEGRLYLIQHMQKERSLRLVREFKKRLLEYSCEICGFDFEKTYGSIGAQFIEAHHVNPLSEASGEHEVSIEDLIAVCANCHRMLHREYPSLTPEGLRQKLVDALENRSIL
ncbi:MAG: HNH endonuclease [Pseudomonadota bacterium]